MATFSWQHPSRPPTPGLQPSASAQPFYLGVLEDGNLVNGNPDVFRALLADLQSRGLDTVLFTNNDSERDTPLLTVSDELNFSVLMIPTADLNRSWWPEEVPATLETAMVVADPIVNRWKPHPSLKGYLTKDEPGLHELEKVRLINEAFRNLDPSRPAIPILIGVDRVGPIFNAVHPDILLIDVYPVGAQNAACDLAMSGFGYPNLDVVDYIRAVIQAKPASVPLWVILQTHSFLDQLREPRVSEVREQHWLAIGEGAKSIFWFIYSSQQGWKGLRDNPELYAEVTALTQRTLPLRDLLLDLQKSPDLFTITGTGRYEPYVSTLNSVDHRHFLVAVNRDCLKAQDLTISSPSLKGQLKDLETSARYDLGVPIRFPPGDGKLFELIPTRSMGADTLGVFRPSNAVLYLKNTNTTGYADVAINYGLPGDHPVVGDWNGDGTTTIGIYRNGSFYLRNSNTPGFADLVFAFGAIGDQPIAGDWDGDGVDTIGVYRNGTFLLRNSNSVGTPGMSFVLGNPGDVAIAGDWNGDGFDTTGVFRPSNGALYLKNTNATGFADIQINYGLSGDFPIVGDWDGDGDSTIGIYRNGSFYLRNSNTIGFADIVFALGVPGDMPIAGDWDGNP